jgi:hypothetical protein
LARVIAWFAMWMAGIACIVWSIAEISITALVGTCHIRVLKKVRIIARSAIVLSLLWASSAWVFTITTISWVIDKLIS